MIRTRMAPSPTGEYHIGHIRTILYNVALAKKNNGKFIIRIEDTDRVRLVEGAIDRILDVISDYGFTWDEGPRVGGKYGPYIQSERLPIYNKYAHELVIKKAAYYCFCTPERLADMRAEQKARKISSPKYDKFCLRLSKTEIEKNLSAKIPSVIRLNVQPNQTISFTDIVFGKISVSSNDIDDQILLKSDGFPTYHLAVVVDDHLMEITHVMRGNDWIPSTPKHVIIYDAFGWKLPNFIHLPNLKELGSNQKLSKRYGPVSAREFLDAGYLPQAVVNFLMLLGWNPGTQKEIFTMEEFIQEFSVEKIHKTDLVAFDRQKLTWMNQQYIQNLTDDALQNAIQHFFPKARELKPDTFAKLLPLLRTRMATLKDFEEMTHVFFVLPGIRATNETERNVAGDLLSKLTHIRTWQHEEIFSCMKEILVQYNVRMPLLYKILTGKERGLPLPETVEILGKERTIGILRFYLKG